MGKEILLALIVSVALASCERAEDIDSLVTADSTVFFKTSGGLSYHFSDFAFYDSSAYIFYFRRVHEELKDLESGTFAFFDKADTIYKGNLWPVYYNSIAPGAFILVPPIFYGNYVLAIENWRTGKPDPRNNLHMISVLKSHGMLHSGLSLQVTSVESNGTRLTVSIRIINKDTEKLLILDPEKMGTPLFHFFTNGIIVFDNADHFVFTGNVQSQVPDPWNSWKTEWFTELDPDNFRDYTLQYTLDNVLPSGTYTLWFTFPGLSSQLSKDQLYQGDARIFLGEVQCAKKFTL